MAKKSSQHTRSKKVTSSAAPSLQAIYRRWLVAGLLGVAFILTAGLIMALYTKDSGGVTTEGALITSTLIVLAFLCGLWWLIESALGIILYITRNSKPAKKKK